MPDPLPFTSSSSHSIAHDSRTAASLDGDRKDVERGIVADPPAASNADPYLIVFEPEESANPQDWSLAKRWYLTALGGILVLNA